MKGKAFTLVELLVVIAILGVLAALMYPVISKMREKGRQAQCANNLKELHTAIMSYATDRGRLPYSTTYKELEEDNMWHEHKGWVGPYQSKPTDSAGVIGQIDMVDGGTRYGTICVTNGTLYSYINDKKVYLCPTFAIEAVKVDKTANPIRSYVMNSSLNYQNIFSLRDGSRRLLFTELNTATIVDGVTVATITAFSSAAVSANNPADSGTVKYYTPKSTDGMVYCPTNSSTETLAAYHNGKGHAVFADGHIEFIYYSNTWAACAGNW